MVYRLKKTFQFRDPGQAASFLDLAKHYGRGRVFGSAVMFEGSLEFSVWRKLQNLATLVSECTIGDIDIYKISSKAGFRVFRQSGL